MREIIKSLFYALPFPLKDYIQNKRRLKFRDKIISEWIAKGKPVPPPHALKQIVIEEFRKKFNYDILIETGTFQGDMVETQRKNFKEIYSIELSEKLFNECKMRFSRFNHINLLQGDSSDVLPVIMKKNSSPAIFWLDGHYSGGITAKGTKSCPIYEELNAVFSNGLNHVLLIDDARDFNGLNDYPALNELEIFICKFKPSYSFEVKDNIIRAYQK